MNPLISVCVPTYNGGKYLRESLECIVNQTYQNLEILIVDDQSKDETITIVEEFQNEDSRIKLIQNEENLGLVGNWNKCIDKASGEWIKLHFQDDLMEAETVEKMVGAAHQFDVKFVLTDREYFFEGPRKGHFDKLKRLSNYYPETTLIHPNEISAIVHKRGIEHNFLGEPILGIMNRKLVDDLGNYDDRLKQIVDLEYWLRVCLNVPFVFIADQLHKFRVHEESQGAKNGKMKGVNPTHLDQIIMVDKIIKDEVYSKYREENGADFMENYLSFLVTRRAFKYGYRYLGRSLDKTSMSYFRRSKWNVFRARFGDIKSFFKYSRQVEKTSF